MKKEKKYRFAYSGDKFEGFKDFSFIADLRKFLRTVPEYELKNSIVTKNKGGVFYIGAYVKDKRVVSFYPPPKRAL